ncbi:hypothetical protein [Actinomadura sp. 6N118]|uniref:hypothetical protein n=1 Tax=Actinomadura sp. 6N118 TaxID=3375151 RepID=UPI0037B37F3B
MRLSASSQFDFALVEVFFEPEPFGLGDRTLLISGTRLVDDVLVELAYVLEEKASRSKNDLMSRTLAASSGPNRAETPELRPRRTVMLTERVRMVELG